MVNGRYPALRVAIQAYFSPHLQFEISDPDDFDDDASNLDFDVMSALKAYYSTAYSSTQQATETRKLAGLEFLLQRNEEVGVTIGLEKQTKDMLDSDVNPYSGLCLVGRLARARHPPRTVSMRLRRRC